MAPLLNFLFPYVILPLKECKDDIGIKSEAENDAENGVSSLITKTMVHEEEKLLEERLKKDEKADENEEKPNLNDIQFSKLDELLTQTQLYSEFLLEKMDNITQVSFI